MIQSPLSELLEKAIAARSDLFEASHELAFRLFNGFSEGNPNLVVDLYARTLLLHNYADAPEQTSAMMQEAREFYQGRLPWLKAGMVKVRNAKTTDEKRGKVLFGTNLDSKIKDSNTWYAIDMTLNQDASFYLDTRNLRKWITENMKGKTVLNAFAYTGSLGVAAMSVAFGGVNAFATGYSLMSRILMSPSRVPPTFHGPGVNRGLFVRPMLLLRW